MKDFNNLFITRTDLIDEKEEYLSRYRNWITAVEEYCADRFEKKPHKYKDIWAGYYLLKTAMENAGLENELSNIQLWEIINGSKQRLLNN